MVNPSRISALKLLMTGRARIWFRVAFGAGDLLGSLEFQQAEIDATSEADGVAVYDLARSQAGAERQGG